jgi:hypothetical protein
MNYNHLTKRCTGQGFRWRSIPAGELDRSAAVLSPKKRGRLPAERPGGIRCFVVGAMHFNNHCTGLSTIVNGNCRAARPAPPPNKRMNPTLLFFELPNALRQRKSQTFHHSSARPARRVIRRAVMRLSPLKVSVDVDLIVVMLPSISWFPCLHYIEYKPVEMYYGY